MVQGLSFRRSGWITGNDAAFGADASSHPQGIQLVTPPKGLKSGSTAAQDGVLPLKASLFDKSGTIMRDPTGRSTYLEGIEIDCVINPLCTAFEAQGQVAKPLTLDASGYWKDENGRMTACTKKVTSGGGTIQETYASTGMLIQTGKATLDELSGYATFNDLVLRAEIGANISLKCSWSRDDVSLDSEVRTPPLACMSSSSPSPSPAAFHLPSLSSFRWVSS